MSLLLAYSLAMFIIVILFNVLAIYSHKITVYKRGLIILIQQLMYLRYTDQTFVFCVTDRFI